VAVGRRNRGNGVPGGRSRAGARGRRRATAPAPVENSAKADKPDKGEKEKKEEKKEEKDLPIAASLEVRGSGAIGTLARAMAELYMADHPDTIVTVQTCGANRGSSR